MTNAGVQEKTPLDDGELIDRIRGFIATAADLPVESIGADDDLYEKHALDSLGATLVMVEILYQFDLPDFEDKKLEKTLVSARLLAEWVRRASHDRSDR